MHTASVPLRSEVSEPEAPFEMANLRPASTGLPMVIWVSEKGHARHGPRIKVCLHHGPKANLDPSVSVSIADEPEVGAGSGLAPSDFQAIKNYIRLNKTALLAYWNGEIDTAELICELRKVTPTE